MQRVPENQIEQERTGKFKPHAIDCGSTNYPLSDLSDRDFEILSYLLVQEEIKASTHDCVEADSIALMKGSSDQGRDCTLYNNNNPCGLIQCKNYTRKLTKPALLKELTTFAMHAWVDDTLFPGEGCIYYSLHIASELTGPATELANQYRNLIQNEIKALTIEKYIGQIAENYECFKTITSKQDLSGIYDILRRINLKYSDSTDISNRLNRHPHLANQFFRTQKIIDIESADNLMRKAMDDYGLRLLTDQDLSDIKNRIQHTKQDHRTNFGFIDFFGYSHDFIKSISHEDFGTLLRSFTEALSILDKLLLDYIHKETYECEEAHQIRHLVQCGNIHPFSAQAFQPFLVRRLGLTAVSSHLPESLRKKIHPEADLPPEDLIEKIRNELLETTKKILANDWSELRGDEETVKFKQMLYNDHIHRGIHSVDDARSMFERDKPQVTSLAISASNKILPRVNSRRTIVIKDLSFLDGGPMLEKFKSSMKLFARDPAREACTGTVQ